MNKEQLRIYKREWVRKRRSDYFADKACVKCNSIENLELDYIDRTQKITSNIWSWAKERREIELAKCQVLCNFCHKIKTREEFSKPLTHGRCSTYRKKDCRCNPCSTAEQIYHQDYRQRRVAQGLRLV